MANIILKGDDFVGIADDRRRMIKEAMAAADAMGVLPDDQEKRKAIIDRMDRRLARAGRGWGGERLGTVVRVDDQGVARVIPQGQGIGFLPGTMGGRSEATGQATWRNLPDIQAVPVRVAAERFHQRMVDAIEKKGYIPVALREELMVEGWREGRPIPRERIERFTREFQERFDAKQRNRK